MKVSRFGQKIKRRSGISQLMVDMGEGLKAGVDVLMLGGGNPSHIPEVDRVFRQCMSGLLAREGAFERAVGDYDPPQGNKEFIEAICELLRAESRSAANSECSVRVISSCKMVSIRSSIAPAF